MFENIGILACIVVGLASVGLFAWTVCRAFVVGRDIENLRDRYYELHEAIRVLKKPLLAIVGIICLSGCYVKAPCEPYRRPVILRPYVPVEPYRPYVPHQPYRPWGPHR
jgi:hypothetical protein